VWDGCIGGAFALSLLQAAPARVASAVLQQSIGLSPDNRSVFYALFDDWAQELARDRPELPAAAWASFREHMYGGEFVFSVERAALRACSSCRSAMTSITRAASRARSPRSRRRRR